jgi:hypothetical protein
MPTREDTTLVCPDCGSDMQLRDSRFGPFYGCVKFPKCKATHGAHEDGRPLGIPANAETKLWRIKAHAAFDVLWKGDDEFPALMRRREAYKWMQDAMGMKPDDAHIGRFDIDDCKKLIAAVVLFLEEEASDAN